MTTPSASNTAANNKAAGDAKRKFATDVAEGILHTSAKVEMEIPSRADLTPFELEDLSASATATLDSLERILIYCIPMLRSVTQSEITVLTCLDSGNDGIAPVKLAETVGVTRARLTQILNTLEERGCVRKEPDPSDQRRLCVFITDAGREVVERQRLYLSSLFENYFLLMGEKDMHDFTRLLAKTAEIVGEFDLTSTSELLDGLH